ALEDREADAGAVAHSDMANGLRAGLFVLPLIAEHDRIDGRPRGPHRGHDLRHEVDVLGLERPEAQHHPLRFRRPVRFACASVHSSGKTAEPMASPMKATAPVTSRTIAAGAFACERSTGMKRATAARIATLNPIARTSVAPHIPIRWVRRGTGAMNVYSIVPS